MFPRRLPTPDVFFALSGYLMTRSLAAQVSRGSFSYAQFLTRRFWRLYPALLCTTVGTLAMTYAVLSSELSTQITRSAIASTFAVSNLLFMSEEGYFGTSSALKPLLHTWSLSVEWQFYLVWPIMVAYASRFSTVARPLWPLTLLCVASFAYGVRTAPSMPQAAFFMLPGRAFEFGLGALALTSSPAAVSTRTGNVMSAAGTLLILLSFTCMNSTHGAPALIALPALLGACLVMVSPSHVLANRLYTLPAFDYLGKISYSAYLVHWPVFVFFHNVYEHSPAPWEVEAVVVAAMLVVSALLYHYVEDEFRTGEKRWHKLAGTGLVALVLAISYHSHTTSGWEARAGGRLPGDRSRAFSHTVYLQEAKDLYSPSERPIPGTERSLEYGVVPNATAKSVAAGDTFDGIVVGDSFAAPFAGAFDEIAKRRGEAFVISSHYSCAPFFDAVSMDESVKDYANPSTNPRGKLCKQVIRKDVLGLIKAVDAKIVVLTGNWLATSQMWKAGYESINTNPRRKMSLKPSQLEQTVAKLHSLGRKVLVIGVVPGAHYNVRACMTATGPLAYTKKCPERSRFREPFQGTDYLRRQMQNRVKLRTTFNVLMRTSDLLRQGLSGKWLAYVDPYETMCDDARGDCIVARNGQPFYSDEYHLTANGTTLLTDAVAAAINSLQQE